jgi:hypothetical protein
MHRNLCVAALVALLFTVHARGAIVIYDFESGDDQGFGHKFADEGGGSETFPIVSIGGSNRMGVLRNNDFQEAERVTATPSDPQYLAMDAASNDEAGYLLTYDWYVDTSLSLGNYGTFLQIGTYVNTATVTMPRIFLTLARMWSWTVRHSPAAAPFPAPSQKRSARRDTTSLLARPFSVWA